MLIETKTPSDDVLFEAGCRHRIASVLVHRGAKRVMLVIQPRWADLAASIASDLGPHWAGTFDGVTVQVPEDVVTAAHRAAKNANADWVLAVGGGSAIGVAKVLALDIKDLQIAALPTTYAGSERTPIWGRIVNGDKFTGRDDRVLPAQVFYDPALQRSLPIATAQQSLFNALAHSLEALCDPTAHPSAHAAARDSLTPLWTSIDNLAKHPDDPSVYATALRGAWKASEALAGARMALHHKLAHVLGALGTAHGPTHATLLPYTIAFNQSAAPTMTAAVRSAWNVEDVGAALYDKLHAHGLPTSLSALQLSIDDVERAADMAVERVYPNPRPFDRVDIAQLLHGARLGRRPTANTTRLPLPNVTGPHAGIAASCVSDVETPLRVVVAVHGRGSNADRFVDVICRHLPTTEGVQIIAPQAADNRWYPKGFAAPLNDNQPDLNSALSVLDACWQLACQKSSPKNIVLIGFSQGACLLLTWLAQRDIRPGGVVAMSGAALPGLPVDFSNLQGVPVHLCVSKGDPWIPQTLWHETAIALMNSGAHLQSHCMPGDVHAIHPPDIQAIQDRLDTSMKNNIEQKSNPDDSLQYQTGWGNHLRSETVQGAIPARINGPQKPPLGLFPEQINGTGFTAKRSSNQRTWLYRLRPAITNAPYERLSGAQAPQHFESHFSETLHLPTPQRYAPHTVPPHAHDWLDGVNTFAGAGSPQMGQGLAIHLFSATKSMSRAFCNTDGDLLLAADTGRMRIQTELGWLDVCPGEIAILPRAIRFRVHLPDGPIRGFMAELYSGHFQLPDRGVVGANGLADERHFKAPVACHENRPEETPIVVKQGGQFWQTINPHSPFDVVGWHGRYTPFKYDLRDFMSMGSVSFDHPDPSILTVLTHPVDDHGKNAIDVAAFLGRWESTENTFRPPFFHRNSAVEFNMVLCAPTTTGAYPRGAFSFTPMLSPHGLGSHAHHHNTHNVTDAPNRISDASIWLQFESTYQLGVLPRWLSGTGRDTSFLDQFQAYTLGPLAQHEDQSGEH